MRNLLILLLGLVLPLAAPAYDDQDYPEQPPEVYQDDGYSEEPYPEEPYPEPEEPPYPVEEPTPEMEAPQELDPNDAIQMQEIRAMCQEYAAELPAEDQGAYIEDCMRSQGY